MEDHVLLVPQLKAKKRYSRILKMWIAPEFLTPLGNYFSLQFLLCQIHPQHKAVTEVWSAWSFSCTTEHIVELIKLTKHSSQTETVKLISVTAWQCLNLKTWTDLQVSRMKLVFCEINHQEQDRFQILPPILGEWWDYISTDQKEYTTFLLGEKDGQQKIQTLWGEIAHKTTYPLLLLAYVIMNSCPLQRIKSKVVV